MVDYDSIIKQFGSFKDRKHVESEIMCLTIQLYKKNTWILQPRALVY